MAGGVHWTQVTTGDVLIDQRVGGQFIGDPGRVKATLLTNGAVTAGVRGDLTWFVNRADVDLGTAGQRIVRLRRHAQGQCALLTGAKRHAEVVVVEAEDGDHGYRYELSMTDDGRVELEAVKHADGQVVDRRRVRLR